LKRRALRIAVLSVLWVAGLAVLAGAGLYWRLSQGPVSLAFMGTAIEDAINKQLPEFRISLGAAELELDSETKTPHVRVRNLVLSDLQGQTIASAPKAGVALDGPNLLRGVVSIQSLDLIGPRVSIRRNLDGTLQLGIDNEAAAVEQQVELEPSEPNNGVDEKNDAPAATNSLVSGSRILELLDGGGDKGSLSKLEEVRLSRGIVKLYDEANDSTWFAPRTDLAFRRLASGFVIAAKADVSSGGDPWKLEASVSFRKEDRNYIANVAIENLVPANVADEIYALAQFARLNTPMSGHFEIEAKETGEVTKLTGEVFASAGQVNLPEFIAKPILIDEGTVRVRQIGSGMPYEIVESSLLIGGSRADLKGSVVPQKGEDGRVISYGIELTADNIALDPQGTVNNTVSVDSVSFKGKALVEEQRVDIDDLVVMAGSTGVRLRGVVTGGEESAGIQAAGRLRGVSAQLLKTIWPPILAPRTRGWINENVLNGTISDGVFEVNFPPDSLARAKKSKVLPADAVDMSFVMKNVTTQYFKSLPPLQGASGSASLKNGIFSLLIDGGAVTLPSGAKLALAEGKFKATDLLAEAVPGEFQFDVQGPVASLLEYAALPDLNLVNSEISKLPKVNGKARAIVGLKLPLIKNVPRERVVITQQVSVSDASIVGILPGVDLSDGNFAIGFNRDGVKVAGPAKLNGVDTTIDWQKSKGAANAVVNVETTLTEKMREKLGIKVGAYITGDVPMKLSIDDNGKAGRRIDVEADLSAVDMRVSAAGWSRDATKGTRATFTFIEEGKGGRRIENLKVDGKGLRLRGDLSLGANNNLRVLDFSEIRLSDDDVFTARIEPGEDTTSLTLTGKTFDARPYIKNLVSPPKGGQSAQVAKGGSFIVNARFDNVIANRGESVRDLEATLVTRAGTITTATIAGRFVSGFPINIKLTPTSEGKELRVNSDDGGSALRAANFYSKVAGGKLEFYALMANAPGSPIRNGELVLRKFDVRNEAALAELDSRGRPKKSGPRIEGVSFKRLRMPFKTDAKFVRLCNVELKGNDLGGVAKGVIRKADGAIDITGTMIPAQGINGVLDDIPLFREILMGGKGEGLFGVTFAMGGTISKPRTQVNPLSALAPGFLRKAFEFQGSCG
jgi:hypothetical protein